MKLTWTVLDPRTGRKELWEADMVAVAGKPNHFVAANARLVATLYPTAEGTW